LYMLGHSNAIFHYCTAQEFERNLQKYHRVVASRLQAMKQTD
jgi:hypothetical protein